MRQYPGRLTFLWVRRSLHVSCVLCREGNLAADRGFWTWTLPNIIVACRHQLFPDDGSLETLLVRPQQRKYRLAGGTEFDSHKYHGSLDIWFTLAIVGYYAPSGEHKNWVRCGKWSKILSGDQPYHWVKDHCFWDWLCPHHQGQCVEWKGNNRKRKADWGGHASAQRVVVPTDIRLLLPAHA